KAIRGYVAGQKLHRVVNGKAGGDIAAWRIDVDVDVLLRVFHLQEEQLRDHEIRYVIINRRSNENDAVFEQPRINVIAALATPSLLHHHRHQHRLREIFATFVHFFSSWETGWTLTFAFRKSRVLPSRICSASALRPLCSSSSFRILSLEML